MAHPRSFISDSTLRLLGLAGGILAILLAAVGQARGQGVLIDGFQSAPFTLSTSSGSNGVGANLSGADAVGGIRAVTLFQPPVPSGTATVSLDGGGGLSAGGAGSVLRLGYGLRWTSESTMTGLTTNALNLDLSRTSLFRFVFTSVTGTVRIYANLSTVGGGILSNGNAGDPVFTVSAPGVYDMPFATAMRVPAGFSAPNMADIDFVSFVFSPFAGSSFTLGSIAAVPEPATFWAGGMGLASVVGLLWRRSMRGVRRRADRPAAVASRIA